VYAGVVFLIRRVTTLLRWREAAFFFALVLIFLFKPLVGPYVNLPADYTRRLSPWIAYAKPIPGSNSEINDVILQMVPWAHQVRESWRSGAAPLWNDNAGGGYPLLANGQSSGLSPLRLLGLPLPLGYSMTFEAAMKLLLALTFAFLYARRRWSSAASLVVAVSWGFSTFLIVWLHFPHSTVAAMLPAIFLAIDLLFAKQDLHRIAFAAGVFACVLFGGHPESAAHSSLGAGLYTLFLWLGGGIRRWKPVGALALASGLAALIAAPFLFPFLEALPHSQRWDWIQARLHRIVPQGVQTIVPFFQVGFYGTQREQNMWGPGIAEVICGYAGVLGFFAWFGVLAHLIRSRRWLEPLAYYVLVTPPLMLIVLQWTPLTTAFHRLPLFSMAANGRLRLVLCWAFAVLAGAVVQQLVEGKRLPLAVTIITAIAGLSAALALNRYPTEYAWEHAVMTTIPRLTVIAAALIALLLKGSARRVAVGVLTIIITLDLWSFGHPWNPVMEKEALYPMTPMLRFLTARQAAVERGEAPPFRIAARGPTFFPNSAAMFGLEDVRSHDPMSYGRTLGALRVFTGYSSFDYFGMLKNFEDPYLDYLNVKYLIVAPHEDNASDRFRLVYDGRDGRIYQNRDVLPRFYPTRNVLVAFDDDKRIREILQHHDWKNLTILKRIHTSLVDKVRTDLLTYRAPDDPIARVDVTRRGDSAFLLDIDASRWTLIVGSQPNYPGWKVFLNGNERLKIIEVNAAFIGFMVPPGRSRVEVVYRPLSYTYGVALSVLTIAILAVALVRKRRILYP
jgi:hypothetical protein